MVDTTGAGDAFVGSLVDLLATYPLLSLPDAVGNAVVGLLVRILFVGSLVYRVAGAGRSRGFCLELEPEPVPKF